MSPSTSINTRLVIIIINAPRCSPFHSALAFSALPLSQNRNPAFLNAEIDCRHNFPPSNSVTTNNKTQRRVFQSKQFVPKKKQQSAKHFSAWLFFVSCLNKRLWSPRILNTTNANGWISGINHYTVTKCVWLGGRVANKSNPAFCWCRSRATELYTARAESAFEADSSSFFGISGIFSSQLLATCPLNGLAGFERSARRGWLVVFPQHTKRSLAVKGNEPNYTHTHI